MYNNVFADNKQSIVWAADSITHANNYAFLLTVVRYIRPNKSQNHTSISHIHYLVLQKI